MPRSAGRGPGPAFPAPPATGLAVIAALICALIAGCAVGPSIRPPVAVRGASAVDGVPPPPPPTAAAPQGPRVPVPDVGADTGLDFIDCSDDLKLVLPRPVPPDRQLHYECADLPVIDDSANGRRRQSSIGLMRVTLVGQPPLPPLLVLGDSDGETGTMRAARLSAEVPLALLRKFSIVGMDRRGQGTSRLDCAPPELRSEILDADVAAGGQPAADALLEDVRRVVQECYLTEGDTITSFDTVHTASDVDRARALLGVRTLSALGSVTVHGPCHCGRRTSRAGWAVWSWMLRRIPPPTRSAPPRPPRRRPRRPSTVSPRAVRRVRAARSAPIRGRPCTP